ncbi:MAG: hypothetical protein ACQEXJ_22090, partial [Myxococcota bacterium]
MGFARLRAGKGKGKGKGKGGRSTLRPPCRALRGPLTVPAEAWHEAGHILQKGYAMRRIPPRIRAVSGEVTYETEEARDQLGLGRGVLFGL